MDITSMTNVLLDTAAELPEAVETASAFTGNVIAYMGAAICAILAGIGSALGVMMAGKAAAGVASEKPGLFGKLLVLQALPGTQGIYGFLTAILVLIQFNGLGSDAAILTTTQGWQLFFAAVPMAVCGLLSGWAQGKAAVAAIHMTGKQPDASGKGITMTALVETYAILALLISILLIRGVNVG